jgi:hypothetical protein
MNSRGYTLAQYDIGVMYLKGNGTSQDNKEAITWFLKAAEKGDTKAQNNLGSMYKDGRGVAQDYKQAVHWYRMAAEQDDSLAQYNLGMIYIEGKGVTEDFQQAKEWFLKAVIKGNANAMRVMGMLSETKTEQYAWYSLAASYGSSKAKDSLDDLTKKMNSTLVAKGKERTKELQRILNEAGMK